MAITTCHIHNVILMASDVHIFLINGFIFSTFYMYNYVSVVSVLFGIPLSGSTMLSPVSGWSYSTFHGISRGTLTSCVHVHMIAITTVHSINGALIATVWDELSFLAFTYNYYTF